MTNKTKAAETQYGYKKPVNKDDIKKAAEQAGFGSKATPQIKSEAKPKKQQTVKRRKKIEKKSIQISIRITEDTAHDFYSIAEAQDPHWSNGYTFERAVNALIKELK